MEVLWSNHNVFECFTAKRDECRRLVFAGEISASVAPQRHKFEHRVKSVSSRVISTKQQVRSG